MCNNISYKKVHSESDSGYYMDNIKIRKPNIDLGVDATYVIHLMNNGRLESIKNAFTSYRIKGKNHILYNQGYASGKKDAIITGPALDLINAYLYIFQHALYNNYANILILEDDFFFDKIILQKNRQECINNFIKNTNYELYFLGCLPYVSKEIDKHTSRLYASTGMHAVIYSSGFIELTLKTNKQNNLLYQISDWDAYTCIFKNYMYNVPLCYQLFPETPNQKQWGKSLEHNKYIGKWVYFFVKRQIKYIRLLQLHKTHIIGYPIFYHNARKNYINMINWHKIK